MCLGDDVLGGSGIRNNEGDSFMAAAVGNWATMTVELPGEVGNRVKEAPVAKQAKASA